MELTILTYVHIPYMSNHSRGKTFAVANHECLPLKIFLEYWRHPLTTQNMVSPRLINE